MRCPFAAWRPGPVWKQGYSGQYLTHRKEGIVDHSMEGWRPGAESRLFGPDEASWHFSIYQDGTIEQHYEVEAVVWHCGYPGNLDCVGIEHEGKDQPLTDVQYEATLRLHLWLFEHLDMGAPALRVNLWEHNWLWPTSCPNGRIPWERLLADLEDGMDEATVKGIVDKALKPVLRALEMEGEKDALWASLEAWLAQYGKPGEGAAFDAFIDKHIAWRLRDKPGWTVPD